MNTPAPGGADNTDATGNTNITDFTQIASCAVGQDHHELRRRKIREDLVREHFAENSATPPAAPSFRQRLLTLLGIN